MFRNVFLSFLLLTFLNFSNGASNCPLYGPIFPAPQKASLSSSVQAGIQGLNASLFQAIDTTYGINNSYSIQVFSSSEILFEYYHTASTLPKLNAPGVKKVDSNTVYRIGSITKIFTMYAFLLGGGDKYFSHPITEFVPELAALARDNSGNDITKVDWSDITIADLASHMAGIASDSYVADLALLNMTAAVNGGFPMLSPFDVPNCGFYPTCTRSQFFSNFARYYPAVAVSETPIYSNVAFQILSYALESITGKSFTSSLMDSVLTPLRLTRTYYNTPDPSLGIIPGSLAGTRWSYNMNIEGPAGILYTSVKDLSTLGQSILKKSLLTPLQTRRWLKPAALTSDVRETVGYPWGIRRLLLNESQPYTVLTAYSKGGNIGAYASDLTIIPELDIGFSVLIAGDKSVSSLGLATLVGAWLLPPLQATARDQATALYGGTYRNNVSGNSTITITSDPLKPGLGVKDWYNNGKNMLDAAFQVVSDSKIISPTFEARLYPTELQATDNFGNKLVTFKAIFEDLTYQAPDSLLLAACGTWIGPTGVVYGSQALDEFIFTINPSGRVVSVLNSALRATLYKV